MKFGIHELKIEKHQENERLWIVTLFLHFPARF